ncbi:DEAD/DEAH box helicase [Halomonas piscis]|uniref:DEAD/DEAH box helicase n=1 Tax=Halomonas piscis TaxID=3031727 RepID=UPI0028A26498|nr:DEAD/DEAH box helicase family protein [Halomonas piscis]
MKRSPSPQHAQAPHPPLRTWQAACLTQALASLSTAHPHFLCQATPGAGKMRLAAELANALIARGDIDHVLYHGPTRAVVRAAVETLESHLARPMNGQLGAVGASLTYHALAGRLEALKQLGQRHRVLLIWDESHHAAGRTGGEGPNQWGMALMALERHMTYTLALSGTPWRTDGSCLPLLRYLDVAEASSTDAEAGDTSADAGWEANSDEAVPAQRLQPDFVYPLREAIRDGVCRYPHVQLVDNRAIKLTDFHPGTGRQETRRYSSIPQLLRHPTMGYPTLVRLSVPMQRLLTLGGQQLDALRRQDPSAAGLVVAADIAHAEEVTQQLEAIGYDVCLVTSRDPSSHARLKAFRESSAPWIVSVGMVAEGVDIPRLRVCCYLSHIRTEQYFRQVLGRLLRRCGDDDRDSFFYALNDTWLAQMARRLSDDLPQDLATVSAGADTSVSVDGGGAVPSEEAPSAAQAPAGAEAVPPTASSAEEVAVSWGEDEAQRSVGVAPDVAFSEAFFERLIALRLTNTGEDGS